ncbi:MAG TPA: acetoin utilization protein AcuC [Actinomycetota bacterium]|nr:acetoin utilization protein AcuC [Actinomycetota bacterium]
MSGACALAADERLAAYDFGPDHPFQAGRLEAGLSLLRAAGVLDDADLLAFGPAADDDLELVHDRAYLAALARFSADPAPADPAGAARFGLVGDNRPFPGMEAAARLVAGATVASLDAVAAGDLVHVFAPVAGLHHARRDRAVGFCLVDDVAVAIARCTTAWPLRVLYVDLDAHHGDGVQAAFYDDPRVCTVSLHETGRYLFPGSGEVHELGRPPGTRRSVNVPLEPGTGDDGVLAAFDAVVEPLAAAFRPDLLVTQNGCDGHADDPLSDLAMSLRGFRALARRLHRLAHRHCQGRWVATGGGGYDLDRVVPRAWALLWSELSGRRLPSRVQAGWLGPRRRRPRADAGARELEERNQRTVRAVRRLALPPAVRVVYPLARRRAGGPGRLPGWEPRAGDYLAPGGPLVLRDRCPASLLRRLEVDPGIHAFVRDAQQEREVLARIAEEPTGEVVVAHTPEGVVVGYVAVLDPEPGTRFSSLPGLLEVGAIEVASGWRRGGVAGALLRFAVEPDPFEDLILIASGLAWHWDLDQSGLPAVAYRRVLRRVFEVAGFESLRTDEPEIAYHPANLFVARIGSRVPPARRALFTSRLVRATGGPTAGTPPDAVP